MAPRLSSQGPQKTRPCPSRARQEGHPRRFTVIRGATSSALDLCSRRSSDRGRCLCRQGISRPLYSAEVQQRALTTASLDNHQHPELAGMAVKDPAAPLVRNEEAAVPVACLSMSQGLFEDTEHAAEQHTQAAGERTYAGGGSPSSWPLSSLPGSDGSSWVVSKMRRIAWSCWPAMYLA